MRLPVLTLAVSAVLACAGPALAQQPPMPNPAEIKKRIKEAFPKLIEQAEVVKVTFGDEDMVTLSYKQVPTDPKDIAKALGKEIGTDKLPDNMLDQYIGMFAPQIAELLNENLGDIGELKNTKELKVKSKRIPVGTHRIGLVFKGEKPVGFVIFDTKECVEEGQKPLKKPVLVKLKTKSSDMNKALEIELKPPTKEKKGKVQMDIYLSALRYKAKSSRPLEIVVD